MTLTKSLTYQQFLLVNVLTLVHQHRKGSLMFMVIFFSQTMFFSTLFEGQEHRSSVFRYYRSSPVRILSFSIKNIYLNRNIDVISFVNILRSFTSEKKILALNIIPVRSLLKYDILCLFFMDITYIKHVKIRNVLTFLFI